jgi:galactoside O-acetyltransferase
MSFYTEEELQSLHLGSYGKDVKISRHARLYNPQNMFLGSHVRIDDFCMLSASATEPFRLDDYIHISAGVYIFGTAGLHIHSFCNISSGTKVYTVSDTFSGDVLVGPSVPNKYRGIVSAKLVLPKHVWIGPNSVVLPGVKIGEGCAIGAMSFVRKSCDAWSIYGGNPLRFIKKRSETAKELEAQFISDGSETH